MLFKTDEELRRAAHELAMEFVRGQCRAQLDGRKRLPYATNEVATAYAEFYQHLLNAFKETDSENEQ